MIKACIKTEAEIEQFRALQAKVDKIVVEKKLAEFDYGDIPEEFKGKVKYFETRKSGLFLFCYLW